jgi:hypothetical protein
LRKEARLATLARTRPVPRLKALDPRVDATYMAESWKGGLLAIGLIVLVGCSPKSLPPHPPPTPSRVVVPDVVGLTSFDAHVDIQDAGLVMTETSDYSAKKAGTVLTVSPPPGTSVDKGSVVALVEARPYPAIPRVVGFRLAHARNALKARGFKVGVTKQVSNQPKDTVIAQNPVGGTRARPGKVVTLTIAKPPMPCTPGYWPCLPPGPSDYDCYGGSGNGPAYTTPGVAYQVTGFDPYDLDRDGNGWGCE